MAYTGPERRRRRILVTEHTEYHLRDGHCVAVRDAKTGRWQLHHRAIGQTVAGGFGSGPDGSFAVVLGQVDVGQQVCFENDLMTTPVQQIRRPSINTLDSYPRAAII